jgi:hypothetical protein
MTDSQAAHHVPVLCYHPHRTASLCWGEQPQIAGWPLMHKITCDDCGATARWTHGSTEPPVLAPTPVNEEAAR